MDIEMLAETTLVVTCAAGWEQRAAGEVRRAVPGSTVRQLFLRGNLLARCKVDMDAALAGLAEAETEHLGRAIPVAVKCNIGKGLDHLETLVQASQLLALPDHEASFRALCDRRGDHEWDSRDAEMAVGGAAAQRTGAPVDLETPKQLITIQVFQDIAFLGACWADELLHKEITKMRKYPPGQRPLNRAELKLREIIQLFGLVLPAEGRALDIGAAPGGWAKVLAEHVAEVVAVDRADLDPRVAELPNVRHIAARSEELAGEEDLGAFDMITNDMNIDPAKSAQVMCDLALAGIVKPGAVAVMTVKFVTRRRRQLVQQALDALGHHYTQAEVRRVPHNARETTLVARRKGN